MSLVKKLSPFRTNLISKRLGAAVGCFALMATLCTAGPVTSGAKIQAILDNGNDVELKPGQVVLLQESLKFRVAGQKITTTSASTAEEYARIVHADGAQGTLIEAKGIEGASLSKLILDGNRPGYKDPLGEIKMEPMLSFGGEGGDNQVVRSCIVIGGRSSGGWGGVHLHEGGTGTLVEDNVIFSIGSDIRGNGRSLAEKPFGFGDGVSTASRETIVRNNLIYDATDEGIMVQGGPGSQVIDNVVVALSREMFGGIALIDPFEYYNLDAEKKIYDYRDVVVADNLIVSAGSRVHVALAMGGAPWNSMFEGTTLIGAKVLDNHVSGSAAGYGYVAKGIDDFEISGNTSDAVYSGIGDGVPGTPPDEPKPFLYDPDDVGTSRLQEEFVPQERSLVRVIRSSRTSKDSRDALGYRDGPYPDPEVEAIVRMAFVEMLGREPSPVEENFSKDWMKETRSTADALRQILLSTPEFVQLHGYVNPLNFHTWRHQRWLNHILKHCSAHQSKSGEWPNARELNATLLDALLLQSTEKQ